MESGVGEREDAAAGSPAPPVYHQTAVALFDDVIDAEGALRAIERGASSPEQVSLLVWAREVDPADADRAGAVARSLVATALETVGGWLLGLSSLIVAERGTYLVAGPLGAALATGGADTPLSAPRGPVASERSGVERPPFPAADVLRALEGFGFPADEATYLEHRLAAGAVLIAVTSSDPRQLLGVRQLFSAHDAVYISQGQTASQSAVAAITALTGLFRAVGAGDDQPALPSLGRLCQDPAAGAEPCGAVVIDRFGDEAGLVDDLFVDEVADAGPVPRFVIVEFGGLLGLGRQHVAVPAPLVDLAARPVQLAVERMVLHHAPRFAGDGALTHRAQLAICAYFGVTPYWLDGGAEGRRDGEGES